MTRINHHAAVLGKPIAHSLSPTLHHAAYQALGLHDWRYARHEVDEDRLSDFIDSCDNSWAGLSLTMPLKQVALNLVDVVEPLAETVGAINTVLFSPGRLLVGANTDVYGMVEAIQHARRAVTQPPQSGVIIGGGATAASAIAALGQLGIKNPTVLVRSLGRSGVVIRAATSMGVSAKYETLGTPEAHRALQNADIVISTIPAEAAADLITVLRPTLQPHHTLLDVIYEGWPTPLARAWAERGGSLAPGYDMLLYQACEQVRLMTGKAAPVEAMRSALYAALELDG